MLVLLKNEYCVENYDVHYVIHVELIENITKMIEQSSLAKNIIKNHIVGIVYRRKTGPPYDMSKIETLRWIIS